VSLDNTYYDVLLKDLNKVEEIVLEKQDGKTLSIRDKETISLLIDELNLLGE